LQYRTGDLKFALSQVPYSTDDLQFAMGHISYCSTEVVTWNLHCARCLKCYCITALMTCNLHRGNYFMRHCCAALYRFSKRDTRVNFLSLFYRRIQSFPTFHWFGDETLAILDDSPLKKQDTKVW